HSIGAFCGSVTAAVWFLSGGKISFKRAVDVDVDGDVNGDGKTAIVDVDVKVVSFTSPSPSPSTSPSTSTSTGRFCRWPQSERQFSALAPLRLTLPTVLPI